MKRAFGLQRFAGLIKKLVNQTEKAAKLVGRNRFLIETMLSTDEARRGKINSHASAKQLFARLAI
ncbi:MAG: hypothetical protein NTZ38_02515 [Candidatus Taylorbacteria bacterium]|nr:hypothetical protein [Candidatus Taylorbacteria bacterium]